MTPKAKLFALAAILTSIVAMMWTTGWEGILGIVSTHAQETTITIPFTFSGKFVDLTKQITTFLIGIMNAVTWMLFMLLDHVLNPVWIFDLQSGNGLTNMLREIWQLCRDLVNLGLALGLIGGAIVMIVKSDASMIKTALPKFVMAVVLVNFSWFVPRAIFDASQILTYTVYQIPSLLGNDGCVLPPTATEPARPCDIIINYAFFGATESIDADGSLKDPTGSVVSTGWSCMLKPLVCVQKAPFGSPQATVNIQMHTNVINGLIVNHARLQSLVQLSDDRPGGIGALPGNAIQQAGATIAQLIKMIIILLFHIALFFPILALVAAFFMRIPVLWVTMAFMPLTALFYVFGDVFGEANPKKLFMDQFLQAVFLPVKVAVPFTIGFIMVNAGAQTFPPEVFNTLQPIAIFSGVSNLWQMMWMIIAVYIIWKYSFEALKSGGEQINFATEKIQSFGKNTFSLAAQAGLNVPFIPIPGVKGGATLAELGRSFNPQTGLTQIRTGQPLQSGFANIQQLAKNREDNRNRFSTDGGKAHQVIQEHLGVTLSTNIKNHIQTFKANPANIGKQNEAIESILAELRTKKEFHPLRENDAIEAVLHTLGIERTDHETAEAIRKHIRTRPSADTTIRP